METPRPTLEVTNLTSPPALRSKRRADWKKRMKAAIAKPPEHTRQCSNLLSRYRKRQTKLLGESDEDPCPYKPTYVFYCLDSPPKE